MVSGGADDGLRAFWSLGVFESGFFRSVGVEAQGFKVRCLEFRGFKRQKSICWEVLRISCMAGRVQNLDQALNPNPPKALDL